MSSSIATSFLGAIQASVAVLLTVFYGVLAAQFNLMSEATAKDISKTCVKMFLPALLIHNLGSQLEVGALDRYVPCFLWSVAYNVTSMVIGVLSVKIFKLPTWVSPAIAFNNTTSLPLLLVQSLDATGILDSLLMDSSDSTSDAVSRAKSYFLVNAMVSNSLTFALGPRLLNGQNEDSPNNDGEEKKQTKDAAKQASGQNGTGNGAPSIEAEEDVERGRIQPQDRNSDDGNDSDQGEENRATEETSLLPDPIVRHGARAGNEGFKHGKRYWDRLPPWAQNTLDFLYQFANAPLIGAVIGGIIGLAPPLKRVFFNNSQEGGVFNAWLTSSIKNVGDLFAALQVIVVGVKLSQAMLKMKRGEQSGHVPWKPMIFITFVRYVLWPLISIPVIWAMATKTNILGNDPILWFTMMLMPTGPPAMKLTALADVNGSDDFEKMSIAKFLTISYTISPLIAFSVVGSLRASEAATRG